MGEGLGRRPRHAHRAGSRRAAPGPHARARGRVPGPRPRGRDGRRVRLLPARQGRRGAVDRHGDARTGGCRARRPPAPRLGHRDRDVEGRREADEEDLRQQGGVGAVAPPRLPAGPGHRRDQGEEPGRDRLHPRRARHHRVGRHVRGGRGQFAVDHRDRPGVHRRERQEGARSARSARSSGAPRGRRAPREGRRARSDDPRSGLARQADGRPLHRR